MDHDRPQNPYGGMQMPPFMNFNPNDFGPPGSAGLGQAVQAQRAFWEQYVSALEHQAQAKENPWQQFGTLWLDWSMQMFKYQQDAFQAAVKMQIEFAKGYLAYLDRMAEQAPDPIQPPQPPHQGPAGYGLGGSDRPSDN